MHSLRTFLAHDVIVIDRDRVLDEDGLENKSRDTEDG